MAGPLVKEKVMQTSKTLVLVVICVLMVAVVASAGENLGISNYQKVSFTGNVRIGDSLLPKGDYEVKHVMEGENHIMIFHQLAGKSATFRVKCTLVPLTEKAKTTEKKYVLNAANEQVMQEIVFRGDSAKHVF
jgi:hypothetical protein